MGAIRRFYQIVINRVAGGSNIDDLLQCISESNGLLFRLGYDGMIGMVPRAGDGAIEWQIIGGNTATPLRVYNAGGGGFHFVATPQSFAVPGSGYTNGIAMSPMQIRGRKATTGAPASGTWQTGDVVMDSAKVWWLCTVGGAPGTWV